MRGLHTLLSCSWAGSGRGRHKIREEVLLTNRHLHGPWGGPASRRPCRGRRRSLGLGSGHRCVNERHQRGSSDSWCSSGLLGTAAGGLALVVAGELPPGSRGGARAGARLPRLSSTATTRVVLGSNISSGCCVVEELAVVLVPDPLLNAAGASSDHSTSTERKKISKAKMKVRAT